MPWTGSPNCMTMGALSRNAIPTIGQPSPRLRRRSSPTAGLTRVRALRLPSGRRSGTNCGYLSPGARWARASRTTRTLSRLAKPTSAPALSQQGGGSMRSAGWLARNASRASPGSGPPTRLCCGTGIGLSPWPPWWPQPYMKMPLPTAWPGRKPARSQLSSQQQALGRPGDGTGHATADPAGPLSGGRSG